MKTFSISLTDLFPELGRLGSGATLTAYLRTPSPELDAEARYPALLIFPGGGYDIVSDREAEPIALEFLARGYQCFVLSYTTRRGRIGNPVSRESCYPLPLLEAGAAVAFLRAHADRCAVDPEKVAVMGFSAGAHLAGSLATMWDAPELLHLFQAQLPARPDAVCLGYPVIDDRLCRASGTSFQNLFGEEAPDLCKRFSLQNAVREDMPPVFLWHTAEDQRVPVQNSLLFAQALAEKHVPFSLHIFPHGRHGLALATALTATAGQENAFIRPDVAQWVPLCAEWLSGIFA